MMHTALRNQPHMYNGPNATEVVCKPQTGVLEWWVPQDGRRQVWNNSSLVEAVLLAHALLPSWFAHFDEASCYVGETFSSMSRNRGRWSSTSIRLVGSLWELLKAHGCSHSMVWKAVTWSHPPAEEARRCNLVTCPGGRNLFGEQLDSLCYTWRGETMSQESWLVSSEAILRLLGMHAAPGSSFYTSLKHGRVTELTAGT